MKIIHVVGARPNYMKIAPLLRALEGKASVTQELVHTGQHYDDAMSGRFFTDLGMREPDLHLGVGAGSHAAQTAAVLVGIDRMLEERRPDLLVVAGDVNSTLGAALAAAKRAVPVAHIEAGLRSHDWSMPEEINRVLTDRLSDLLFTHSPEAATHLAREGIDPTRVHFVGNLMVDTLDAMLPAAAALSAAENRGLAPRGYALVTLHRPSNVDDPKRLSALVSALHEMASLIPVLFPVHPRTRAALESAGLLSSLEDKVRVEKPLGYLEFLSLLTGARLVATDSGGVQEETTSLGVPCLTLRDNTERPITTTVGTNRLLGSDATRLVPAVRRVLAASAAPHERPPLWDGHAAERTADRILEWWQAR